MAGRAYREPKALIHQKLSLAAVTMVILRGWRRFGILDQQLGTRLANAVFWQSQPDLHPGVIRPLIFRPLGRAPFYPPDFWLPIHPAVAR